MSETRDVLVIEDDQFWGARIAQVLGECGFPVQSATSWPSAIALLKSKRYFRVVTDLHVVSDAQDGVETLYRFNDLFKNLPPPPTLVVSKYINPEHMRKLDELKFVKNIIEKSKITESANVWQRFLKYAGEVDIGDLLIETEWVNIRMGQLTWKNSLMDNNTIFIGHGRAQTWREIKDFLENRLNIDAVEFNSDSVVGVANLERLTEMLESASAALIVLTGEDELANGTLQARMNVIHEVGLFQGRLGFRKVAVLLEEGCDEFSNIQGIGQIRFPKGNIKASFEEIRLMLEREGILG